MSEVTEDSEYFERRAEAEIAAAQAATHAAVVRAHYELAGHYLDLVHNPDAHAADSASTTESAPAAGPSTRLMVPSAAGTSRVSSASSFSRAVRRRAGRGEGRKSFHKGVSTVGL